MQYCMLGASKSGLGALPVGIVAHEDESKHCQVSVFL